MTIYVKVKVIRGGSLLCRFTVNIITLFALLSTIDSQCLNTACYVHYSDILPDILSHDRPETHVKRRSRATYRCA